jgi:hypothetical protein
MQQQEHIARSLGRHISVLMTLSLMFVGTASAQAVSGWTTLQWDPSTGTLYGYAETSLDDYASIYYGAALNTYIFDSNNNTLAYEVTSRDTAEGFVEAEISATGISGQTYTQYTEHFAVIQYISDCDDPCSMPTYEDYYNYSAFSADGQDDVDYGPGMGLSGPGPQTGSSSSVPRLPPTHTSAVATAAPDCGDSRTTLIAEYGTYKVALTPQCSDLNNDASATYFTNAELTTSESPAYGWSLLTQVLLQQSDAWRTNYGAMTADSVYRNPAHNSAINGASNSQHMFGDAIDISNPTSDRPGRALLISALPTGTSAPDYIEPTSGKCALNCVHADWRNHSQAYAHGLTP